MGRDRGKRSGSEEGDSLRHVFQGREVLDELLLIAGSELDVEGVYETFREAQQAGCERSDVLPLLFDEEPRFPGPDVARRFFENLFGLWDLAKKGQPLPAAAPKYPPREKPEKPVAPEPFGAGEPTPAFIAAVSRFLQMDKKMHRRLSDAFENRQDALLGALDEEGLSDEGYAAARQVLFELFAMLELGMAPLPGVLGKAVVGSVDPRVFSGPSPEKGSLPVALEEFVEGALRQRGLPEDVLAQLRGRVLQGAVGLWKARTN